VAFPDRLARMARFDNNYRPSRDGNGGLSTLEVPRLKYGAINMAGSQVAAGPLGRME